jgi:hypothetical protein
LDRHVSGKFSIKMMFQALELRVNITTYGGIDLLTPVVQPVPCMKRVWQSQGGGSALPSIRTRREQSTQSRNYSLHLKYRLPPKRSGRRHPWTWICDDERHQWLCRFLPLKLLLLLFVNIFRIRDLAISSRSKYEALSASYCSLTEDCSASIAVTVPRSSITSVMRELLIWNTSISGSPTGEVCVEFSGTAPTGSSITASAGMVTCGARGVMRDRLGGSTKWGTGVS